MNVLKLENEDNKKVIITLEEFAFICRICCLKRSDLSLFEGDYLLDLFQTIRNVDVRSTVEYPRNICNGCINELEDISSFVYIAKYNDRNFGNNVTPKKEMIEYKDDIENGMSQESKETNKKNVEDMPLQESRICRICFSQSSSLNSFREKTHLIHMFQNITNIDFQVRAQSTSSEMTSMCIKCTNQLEKISLFIDSSLCYDQKLESVVDRNKSFTHEKLEPKCEIDANEATNLDICSDETFVYESSEKLEIIDIKEEVINGEVASTDQFHKFSFEEKHFDGAISKKALEDFPASLRIQNHDNEDVTTRSGNKLLECNWCKTRFAQKSHLHQHMLTHTGEKPFKCDGCEKSFAARSNLRRHMLTHAVVKLFKCDGCEKSFAQESYLQQHMLTHTGEKQFKCDGCEKSFARKSHLKQHMLTHTGEKAFKCHCCEKCFAAKSKLRGHMLSHTVVKSFKCDGCEKSFTRKAHLQRHIMYTHTRKSHLQQHMLTNTAAKPFRCDWYGMPF